MRKQYHFRPGPGGLDAWDVDRLIEMTCGLPIEEIAVDHIAEIDLAYWFDETDQPTVRRIVEHMRLVAEVDPSHPIIVDPDGRLMDGMHRVARALLEGSNVIAAVRLRELPEPDFQGCRPQDLPY